MTRSNEVSVPAFVDPPRARDMEEGQVIDFLEAIRARRLLSVHYYQEVQAARKENRRKELDRKYEVLEARIASCIAKIDDNLAKAEGYFSKLAGLKLESM